MQRTLKLYRLPDHTKTPGFRQMTVTDIPAVHKLLNEYLNRFDMCPVFSLADCKHWFLPQNGIVDSFIVQNGDNVTGKSVKKILKAFIQTKKNLFTDFVSFYTLPSTIMHHPLHKTLKAAYSFYNVSTATPLLDLMQDGLIAAKNVKQL